MSDPIQEQDYSAAKSLLVVSIQKTTTNRSLQQHHEQLGVNTSAVEECNQNHENDEMVVKKNKNDIPVVL